MIYDIFFLQIPHSSHEKERILIDRIYCSCNWAAAKQMNVDQWNVMAYRRHRHHIKHHEYNDNNDSSDTDYYSETEDRKQKTCIKRTRYCKNTVTFSVYCRVFNKNKMIHDVVKTWFEVAIFYLSNMDYLYKSLIWSGTFGHLNRPLWALCLLLLKPLVLYLHWLN